MFKIGYGYDSHRFLSDEEKALLLKEPVVEMETEYLSQDKKLIIGGVVLDDKHQQTFGPFKARSDGDVLYHAVVNALLSALGDKKARDIGSLFPNTDPSNSNRNSADFVAKAVELLKASDYELIDLKIMLKGIPRVDYRQVEENLAAFFGFQKIQPEIHIQGTSGEEMDAAGNGLGVEIFAVSLLQHKQLYSDPSGNHSERKFFA
jgi:2-C-methyl-D-erythritol 2,4-cyclodiphosphate synthase